MKNVEGITFRCKHGSRTLYTPEYLFEVAEMRKHQDYDEVDKEGNVVMQATDGLQRPLISVAPAKAPSKRKK